MRIVSAAAIAAILVSGVAPMPSAAERGQTDPARRTRADWLVKRLKSASPKERVDALHELRLLARKVDRGFIGISPIRLPSSRSKDARRRSASR